MARNPESGYVKGEWLFYCDVCGEKLLSYDAKRRWDGLYVCHNDWEPRHPSDFIRARKETSNQLPWSRPKLPEKDVSPQYSDQYIIASDELNVDLGYANTGVYYWYDIKNNVSSTPESYVTGDYY